MTIPQPRRVLTRHDDGTVHLAGPRQSVLEVDLTREPQTKKARKKAKKDEEIVELVVRLTRGDRRRLRRKAARYGWTGDEAATHVLRAWADT